MDELLTPILEATGMRKEFPGVVALHDVDLAVLPGEVHCLVGQNGAGKSTLVKIIMGAYAPDAGQLRVGGHEVVFRSPRDSLRAGISCIFQELDLVPGMTVAENLLLADLPGRYGLIDVAARNRKAEALLTRVGADFGPATIVEQLAVADRQLVAIAKALAVDAKVVLMDEPSAPLTAKELDRLFTVIGELKRAGCGVLYISHRLEELHRVGSIATVLRDGGLVGTYPLPDTPLRSIVAAMIGGEPGTASDRNLVAEEGPRSSTSAPSPSRKPATSRACASGPARSWGSPAWSARGGRRSCGPCSARTGPTWTPTSTGGHTTPGTQAGPSRWGWAWCPRIAASRVSSWTTPWPTTLRSPRCRACRGSGSSVPAGSLRSPSG